MNLLNYLRERAAYWVAKVADSIVGDDPDPQYSPLDNSDGLYDVVLPEPPGSTMTNSEAFDLNAHMDDLAAPLLNTEEIAARVEDGTADADLYDDLLDALVATPDQVWEMFDVATEADR